MFRYAKFLMPAAAALIAIGVFFFWVNRAPEQLPLRVPGTDRGPDAQAGGGVNPVTNGKLLSGAGKPGSTQGNWPQFRGPGRDGISRDTTPLARNWPGGAPKELWSIDVGEGYAGAAVSDGRVYLMDYDATNRQDALRCLSFDTGAEIWRFAYPLPVKRNHGMSRTVPTVASNIVVAMGPKCHVIAVDATEGKLLWTIDLVRQFGTVVPPWYAGQCPLADSGNIILAPGGKEALLLAVDLRSGETVWKTPNPRAWKMTHSSIMPMEVDGERTYVYCADKGVVGISAKNGRLLWQTTDWKISIATVPSPLVIEGGRVFLSGGYNAGSLMLQIKREGTNFTATTLFRLGPEKFGATQQTPIFFENNIYGVRPDGKFVCLETSGKTLWVSEGKPFGLGAFAIADHLVFAVNDIGLLRVIEAASDKYVSVAQAQILNGRESWGPLAITGGRLLARDLTRLACFQVAP